VCSGRWSRSSAWAGVRFVQPVANICVVLEGFWRLMILIFKLFKWKLAHRLAVMSIIYWLISSYNYVKSGWPHKQLVYYSTFYSSSTTNQSIRKWSLGGNGENGSALTVAAYLRRGSAYYIEDRQNDVIYARERRRRRCPIIGSPPEKSPPADNLPVQIRPTGGPGRIRRIYR